MKYTDIAVIGGGLAGSTAAAMLGRAGVPAVLIDPHPVYPPDFRVEKLSGAEQIGRFWLGQGFLRRILGPYKEPQAMPIPASALIATTSNGGARQATNSTNPIRATPKSAGVLTEVVHTGL
jgi:choline dehydrogenase-like flavoprotein